MTQRKKRDTDLRCDYWIKQCKMSDKLKKYIRKTGAISEIIGIIALDIAYGKKGWCIEFDSEEDLIDTIIVNRDLDIKKSDFVKIDDTKAGVKHCIEAMIECKLISKKMYKKGIFTSQSMQLEQMKTRKRGNKDSNYTTDELFGEFCLLKQEDGITFSSDTKGRKNTKVTKKNKVIAAPKVEPTFAKDNVVPQSEMDTIISDFKGDPE